jgi:acetylornithine deacetylase
VPIPSHGLTACGKKLPAFAPATPHARIEIETLNAYPGLDTSEDATFLRDIMRITGDNRASRIGFGTEGGLFNDYLNMPVVVCGPGSIDRAHKADEFILPKSWMRVNFL